MKHSSRCVAALAALSAAAFAQEPAATSVTTLPKVSAVAAEEEGYRAPLAPSLTRTDTPLIDVPLSVSVVTRRMMDDLNVQNIGDAMLYVPGVSMMQGEGNRETPVIRGSSSTGDFFLDGLRDDVQYYRDLYNIDRVEVLKGPNGMLFGRGGVGGVINRVSKQPVWSPVRQLTLQGGSFGNSRISADVGQGVNDRFAFRVNGMYEDSNSYRDSVTLERYGFNPTVSARAGERTQLTFGVEYFHDERVADRGVSSFEGRPLDTDPSTFFGDPAQSPTHTTARMANALVEHQFSDDVVLRNRTRFAHYDKFYQNVYPGPVGDGGTSVQIQAYNNAMERENLFNQTDLTFTLASGSIEHKLLAGLELGRQDTQNLRQTGFFPGGAQNVIVPVSDPRTTLPVTFRPSGSDADNDGTAKIAALYVQDEIHLSPKWMIVAGVRYDDFQVDLHDNRTGLDFSSDDDLFSPRAGVVFKPWEQMSVYASYGRTHQPRAGDQLSSLSASNESLEPEEFTNYEIGAKWDALPDLSLTAAVFRLQRTNVIAPADPNDPAAGSILVDGQRTEGLELGLTGRVTDRWSVIGAYAYQDGEILSDQANNIRRGARLASLPRHTFSLWNRYDLSPAWAVGLGVIHRGDILAATENRVTPASNVTLPHYTRIDAAVYYTISERFRVQLNVENVADEEYFEFAHNNTNITPGSPRVARVVFTANY
ncbi:MAG: TonB-dependent siderophore receptor [Steroidobacteraceae bacterium]|nr:TonB-dependent siderophore receptor [Steroidobacteraceae bacterium]